MMQIPDSIWKGKFVTLTIGKEIIKQPIQSAEHYLRLKALRDNKRIINTGRADYMELHEEVCQCKDHPCEKKEKQK